MKTKLITGILAIFCATLLADQTTMPPSAPGHATLAAAQAALVPSQNRNGAEIPPTVRPHLDITYRTVGDEELKLDLFTPSTAPATTAPCLVFIHGGAWQEGNRTDFRAQALHFAKKGYICAAVSYRLAPASTYPRALEDVEAALEWLGNNADDYQINTNSVAIVGASAGGHLAMLAGYRDEPSKKVPVQIKAIINLYGPSDLTTEIAKNHPAVVQFLGKPYASARAAYIEASPLSHLDPQDPPTLVLHGTLDEIVPIAQSDALVERFQALGIPHHYDRLPGWSHVMDLAPAVYERSLWLMEDFLKTHLPDKRLSQN